MRITIDSNVFIASLISNGTCSELVKIALIKHEIIGSEYIQNEIIEKLINKFKFSKHESIFAANFLFEKVRIVQPIDFKSSSRISDKDDIPIIGTALSGDCEYLITGDKPLQDLHTIESLKIISPSNAWKII